MAASASAGAHQAGGDGSDGSPNRPRRGDCGHPPAGTPPRRRLYSAGSRWTRTARRRAAIAARRAAPRVRTASGRSAAAGITPPPTTGRDRRVRTLAEGAWGGPRRWIRRPPAGCGPTPPGCRRRPCDCCGRRPPPPPPPAGSRRDGGRPAPPGRATPPPGLADGRQRQAHVAHQHHGLEAARGRRRGCWRGRSTAIPRGRCSSPGACRGPPRPGPRPPRCGRAACAGRCAPGRGSVTCADAFGVGRPCLQPHDVVAGQPQLGGVLDGDDALAGRDAAGEGVEQRGLAGAGAARDEDVAACARPPRPSRRPPPGGARTRRAARPGHRTGGSVRHGPSTASGGTTALTREPSGRRASTSGRGAVDAQAEGCDDLLDEVLDGRACRGPSARARAGRRARPRPRSGPLTITSVTSGSASRGWRGPRPDTSAITSADRRDCSSGVRRGPSRATRSATRRVSPPRPPWPPRPPRPSRPSRPPTAKPWPTPPAPAPEPTPVDPPGPVGPPAPAASRRAWTLALSAAAAFTPPPGGPARGCGGCGRRAARRRRRGRWPPRRRSQPAREHPARPRRRAGTGPGRAH